MCCVAMLSFANRAISAETEYVQMLDVDREIHNLDESVIHKGTLMLFSYGSLMV